MTDKIMEMLHVRQNERYEYQDIGVIEDVNVGTFAKADISRIGVLAVVIYDMTTKDHPEWFVARIFDNGNPTNFYILRKTYEQITEDIKKAFPQMIPFKPGAEDDKVILQVWM